MVSFGGGDPIQRVNFAIATNKNLQKLVDNLEIFTKKKQS